MKKTDMNMMALSKQQMEKVYYHHMLFDFPENERKPLSMITDGMENGICECFGFFESNVTEEQLQLKMNSLDALLGYAVFFRYKKTYLLDYFAVTAGNRNRGIGSLFLKKIAERYENVDSLICEAEDPECAAGDALRELQQRRVNFYQRNDFVDTGAKVKLWGVDFSLLELRRKQVHTSEQMKQIYLELYRSMLSQELFDTWIRMK